MASKEPATNVICPKNNTECSNGSTDSTEKGMSSRSNIRQKQKQRFKISIGKTNKRTVTDRAQIV